MSAALRGKHEHSLVVQSLPEATSLSLRDKLMRHYQVGGRELLSFDCDCTAYGLYSRVVLYFGAHNVLCTTDGTGQITHLFSENRYAVHLLSVRPCDVCAVQFMF